MNRQFNLKASIVLFAMVICQAQLRAQSVSKVDTSHVLAMNVDTTLTKKHPSSIVVKSDTALIVKAGATIVQKADTTMVINADPELIRKFNEIVAAKQQADQAKQNSNTQLRSDSASNKQNTVTQVRTNTPPDNSASAPVSSTVPVSVVNPASTASTVATGAATSALTGAAKTDASIPSQTNNANNASPSNTSSQPANNTNNNPVASTTPANKPDSVSAQPVKNSTSQQTAANTNSTVQQNKPDSASTAGNTKKTDSVQQVASGSTTAAKPDSALTANNDTTKAKKDTTVKSDTSKMKKDTSLMVTDTAAHGVKAVAAYIEVGGAGLAISGNYDARFHDQRDGWGYRVGAGYFASGGNTVFTVPFQINYLTGEHSMHIELGAGTTFLNSTGTNIGTSKWEFDKVTGFIATATIGFRYQPEQKGLNFRIAFVPILYDEGLIPAGGVSIGYTFK